MAAAGAGQAGAAIENMPSADGGTAELTRSKMDVAGLLWDASPAEKGLNEDMAAAVPAPAPEAPGFNQQGELRGGVQSGLASQAAATEHRDPAAPPVVRISPAALPETRLPSMQTDVQPAQDYRTQLPGLGMGIPGHGPPFSYGISAYPPGYGAYPPPMPAPYPPSMGYQGSGPISGSMPIPMPMPTHYSGGLYAVPPPYAYAPGVPAPLQYPSAMSTQTPYFAGPSKGPIPGFPAYSNFQMQAQMALPGTQNLPYLESSPATPGRSTLASSPYPNGMRFPNQAVNLPGISSGGGPIRTSHLKPPGSGPLAVLGHKSLPTMPSTGAGLVPLFSEDRGLMLRNAHTSEANLGVGGQTEVRHQNASLSGALAPVLSWATPQNTLPLVSSSSTRALSTDFGLNGMSLGRGGKGGSSGAITPSSVSISDEDEAERAAVAVMAGFRMNGASPNPPKQPPQQSGRQNDAASDKRSPSPSDEGFSSPEPEPDDDEPRRKKSTKKKEYPCPNCPRVFGSSGHLSRHRRIHLDLRPYACPVEGCGARFHRIDNMKSHANTHIRRLRLEQERREAGLSV